MLNCGTFVTLVHGTVKLSCNISPTVFVEDFAKHRIYKQLGDTARPSHWWKQGWFEHNPVQNNETVLGISPSATAPMSSMSDEAWEQQPCNAFSNAAFFEVSLQACKTASAWGQDWSKMFFFFFFQSFFFTVITQKDGTQKVPGRSADGFFSDIFFSQIFLLGKG